MQDSPHEKKRIRPDLLKVLCILTFIGSGMSALANSIMFFTLDNWKLAYENGLLDGMGTLINDEAMQVFLHVNPDYFLIQSLFYLFSLSGALLMWNLRKIGFHLYTIAQILLLIAYNLYLSEQPFPLIPLLLSVTFILLYSRNLTFMH